MAWALFGTRCSIRCDLVQLVSRGLLLVTVHLCFTVPLCVPSRRVLYIAVDLCVMVFGSASVARQMGYVGSGLHAAYSRSGRASCRGLAKRSGLTHCPPTWPSRDQPAGPAPPHCQAPCVYFYYWAISMGLLAGRHFTWAILKLRTTFVCSGLLSSCLPGCSGFWRPCSRFAGIVMHT